MLYGSGAGPNTIASSNFRNNVQDLDMEGQNGPVTVSKSLSTKNTGLPEGSIVQPVTDPPVPDARPRPQS